MSQIDFQLRVRPYVWDRTSDHPIPGVVITRGKQIKSFIPYEKITTVADKMIDLLETHERNTA